MISLTNHDFQWGRSEVVIIYPDISWTIIWWWCVSSVSQQKKSTTNPRAAPSMDLPLPPSSPWAQRLWASPALAAVGGAWWPQRFWDVDLGIEWDLLEIFMDYWGMIGILGNFMKFMDILGNIGMNLTDVLLELSWEFDGSLWILWIKW